MFPNARGSKGVAQLRSASLERIASGVTQAWLAGWPWAVGRPGLPQTRTCTHWSTRFFGPWIRCVGVHRVDHPHRRERVSHQKPVEVVPVQRPLAMAAIGLPMPEPLGRILESRPRTGVAGDPIVRVVATCLLTPSPVLLADRAVSMLATPLSDAPLRPAQAQSRPSSASPSRVLSENVPSSG